MDGSLRATSPLERTRHVTRLVAAAVVTLVAASEPVPLHAQRAIDDAAIDRLTSEAERICASETWSACADAWERPLAALGIQPATLEWNSPGFVWPSSYGWINPMRTAAVITAWGEAVLFGRSDRLSAIGSARASGDMIQVNRWEPSTDLDPVALEDALRRSIDIELMVAGSLPDDPELAKRAFSRVNSVRARTFMNSMWASFEAHRRGWIIGPTGQFEFIERRFDPLSVKPLRRAMQAELLRQTIAEERGDKTVRTKVVAELESRFATVVNEFERLARQLGDNNPSWRKTLRSLDLDKDMELEYGDGDTPLITSRPELVPRGSALVQYHATDRQVFAFFVHNSSLSLLEETVPDVRMFALGEPGVIAGLVRRFKRQLADPTQLGWQLTAGELYRLLLAPILPTQGRMPEHLVIVPSRFLFELPFGLLRDPRTEKLLVETMAHSYVHHPDVLGFLGFGRDEIAESQEQALVVGVRHFVDWPELRLGEEEATRVADILPGPTSLRLASRSSASAVKVVDWMQGHVLVHLSSHATVDRRPWLSGVVLKTDQGQDAVLTALDLVGSSEIFPPGLVVLSACETGIVDPGDNDNIRGLTGGLFLSGFQTIVASQWKVPEEATLRLMTEFYRLLAGDERITVAEALRQAQLRLAAEEHPFYWGAFVVFGNGRLRNTALLAQSRGRDAGR